MHASLTRLAAVLALAGTVGASAGCAGQASTPSPALSPVPPSAVAVATSRPQPTADPSPSPSPASASPAGTPAPVVKGPFTMVSGVESFSLGDGQWTTEAGIDRGRKLAVTCVDVANDPRVSGTTTETWNFDFLGTPPAAGLDWGIRRLENDGGAWEGIVLGAAYPGGREQLTMWLAGSGGYEGMTYYMHIDADTSTLTYPFEGIIYEGTVPIPTFPEP